MPNESVERPLNPGIVSRVAGSVVAETLIKQGKIKLVVDNVDQDVLEGAGQDLVRKIEERAVLCTAWLTANYFIQPLNDERQLFVGCF